MQGDADVTQEEDGAERRGGAESGRESGREGPAGGEKATGKSKKGEGGDQYDYDDGFIDDSEFVEYYAGDRRKAKHSGFFVNSGEIEKVCQL